MKSIIIILFILIASLSFAEDAKVFTDQDLSKYKGDVTDYKGRQMIEKQRSDNRIDKLTEMQETLVSDKYRYQQCRDLRTQLYDLERQALHDKYFKQTVTSLKFSIKQYCE